MSESRPKHRPLSAQAYAYLESRLLGGQMVSGTPIDRAAIAAALGISLAPVTEAISRLQTQGFIEIIPRKGTHVRIVHPAALREQLVLRLALECQVARMVCGDPIGEAFYHLEVLAEQADRGGPPSPLIWDSEVAFHLGLAGLAQVPALASTLAENLRLVRFMALQVLVEGRRQPRGHRTLLRRLETAPPDEAAAAMRMHLVQGREDILGIGSGENL